MKIGFFFVLNFSIWFWHFNLIFFLLFETIRVTIVFATIHFRNTTIWSVCKKENKVKLYNIYAMDFQDGNVGHALQLVSELNSNFHLMRARKEKKNRVSNAEANSFEVNKMYYAISSLLKIICWITHQSIYSNMYIWFFHLTEQWFSGLIWTYVLK